MTSQEKKEETKTEEQNAKSSMPTSEPPPAAEAIEEDDEFEEFDPCRWGAHDEEAEDAQQWQVKSYYEVKSVREENLINKFYSFFLNLNWLFYVLFFPG